jgi:putative transposase
MSGYHESKEHSSKMTEKERCEKARELCMVMSFARLQDALKDGVVALCTAAGLTVLQAMMQEQVVELAGPKGKHNKDRDCYRHGTEPSKVVLGGRKVSIERPRVRTIDGHEVPLEIYELVKDDNSLLERAMELMLHGLSSRNYKQALEWELDGEPGSTSKSTVSRNFIKATRKEAERLLHRRFDDLDIPIVMIDGVRFAEYHVIIAMGITIDGTKRILGLRIGSAENATVCKDLLTDLQERGLHASDGLLAIIDGSKALRSALKLVFGNRVLIQRCHVHKLQNVLDYLPKEQKPWVKRKMRQAWSMDDAGEALQALRSLATSLGSNYPDAAASLREGLEETVTVLRLQISGLLRQTLRSTNAIESLNYQVKSRTRNVKNWKNGSMVQRWVAAGLLDIETCLRRVKGFRDLPMLKSEVRRLTVGITDGAGNAWESA